MATHRVLYCAGQFKIKYCEKFDNCSNHGNHCRNYFGMAILSQSDHKKQLGVLGLCQKFCGCTVKIANEITKNSLGKTFKLAKLCNFLMQVKSQPVFPEKCTN